MGNEDDVSLINIELTCKACGWQGLSQNTDRLIDQDSNKVSMVCPRCRVPEQLKEGYDVK